MPPIRGLVRSVRVTVFLLGADRVQESIQVDGKNVVPEVHQVLDSIKAGKSWI